MAIVALPFSRSSVVVECKNFLINFDLEKLLSPLATLIGRVSNILKIIPRFGAKSRKTPKKISGIVPYRFVTVSRPYRYDSLKQGIIDYHIEKILQEGKIRPVQSPYASPVDLTRKNNGLPPDSPEAYRFAIDYRKLYAITKYLRYPLPLIDDLITNIPHTGIMSTLDLKSGYFQLAINPKDIEKTAFITRSGTYNSSECLSGAAPNFQKAIDIILKPVIGRFVMVYMDDVISTSPSFNEHIDHLNQVFTLLRDAGLTVNKEKCHFERDKLKYLGLIISKEGIETDNSKVKAIAGMKPPKNNRKVSKFLGMAG
ncbi:retrovirus-related Pol polyprotein from transposon opus [Trichonephila clavipes]|nr:retrovirus-related Pol polyprotein from transposon opus [Trichonephila clavipes]